MTVRKRRSIRAAVWESLRDTALLAGFGLAIFVMNSLGRGQSIGLPSGRTVVLAAIVFFVTWAVTAIACVLGATTSSDQLGGPESGLKSRVPGTLVVAVITAFVSFVVLLVGDFFG
jgi:hypothetical protein